MQEIEDPWIKLFGRKIPLSADADCEVKWMEEGEGEAGDAEEETEQGDDIDAQSQSEARSVYGEGAGESGDPNSMKESSKGCNSQGKKLKKPDKILPCPRCDSMDTKFCYYNNYNVNQPRHFCRACQRYWTAGGMMRNMPVGAGRRKNKSAACRYRHIIIPGALDWAKTDVPSSILRFGLDIEKQGEDCSSSASSVTISNSADRGSRSFAPDRSAPNHKGTAPQFPYISSFPWPYPWSPPAPSQGFCPTAAFWTWNIPFVLSQQPSSMNDNITGIPSADSAITPAKRSSDTKPELDSPKQANGCLVVPKIRRMDNPDEAAKCSIWASLGIKHDANIKGSASSGGFLPMGSGKVREGEKLPALQANPAALSRSLNFHENN
ncbi:hypothetical protein MLD38_021820 [Melastoma candidum]|uniref:Uncharacterized protein n=1 Tax=Melastoma candidum TaxID=119954 RepID=A0ACB9QIG8_9MYRT|nr:hypothetical protein MLD38_021820 [Melastoma candidum]